MTNPLIEKRMLEAEEKARNSVAILIVGDDPAVNSAVANAVRYGVQRAGFWDHRAMNNYREGEAYFDNREHSHYEKPSTHRKAVRSLLEQLEETRPDLFNTRVLIDTIDGSVVAKSQRVTEQYAGIYIGNQNRLHVGGDFHPNQRETTAQGIVYIEEPDKVPECVHVEIET